MFRMLLIFILVSSVISRFIELANTKPNEKKEPNPFKKNPRGSGGIFSDLTKKFEDFAKEVDSAYSEKPMEKIDDVSGLKKEKLADVKKSKDKDKPKVSSDKDIKMRGAGNSMEGKSLEGISLNQNEVTDVCLVKDNKKIKSKKTHKKNPDPKAIVPGEKGLDLEDITNEDLVRGIIFSEILDKPVSMR